MCGSGTRLKPRCWPPTAPPGLHRGHCGFSGWAQYDENTLKEVVPKRRPARKGLAEYTSHYGLTATRASLNARSNARRAGIGRVGDLSKSEDVANLTNPLPKGLRYRYQQPAIRRSVWIANRLVLCTACWAAIYEKDYFGGWNLSLFEKTTPELLSCLQLRADRQFKAKNGPLDCVQKNYHLAGKRRTANRRAWRKITLTVCART